MSLLVLSGRYMNIFVKLYFSIVAVLHQRVFINFLFLLWLSLFFFQLHTLLYVPKKMHESLHK